MTAADLRFVALPLSLAACGADVEQSEIISGPNQVTFTVYTDADCTELPGTFSCACKTGYVGDGTSYCYDVDECTENTDNCHALAT